jgi:3-hydroxybutyryl-CoA dehydrogenase
MGAGIAQVAARAGFETILFDINKEVLNGAKKQLEKALSNLESKGKISAEEKSSILGRIRFTHHIEELRAALVIEAIIERLEPKQELFTRLAEINGPESILASNTSSIPITQIARGIPNPKRVLGIHFFNPAPVMKLVELIAGVQTSDEVLIKCKELIGKMGKTCVLAKDSPGFIVNRVARHYYVESLKLLEENACSFQSIDELLESSGFKMGAFRLMDLIGVDTNFSVTSSMYEQFHQDAKFRPSRIQQQKVVAGLHGRKSGKGFYEYE